MANCPAPAAQRTALDWNIKCESARPCQHCVDFGTECIDNARRGTGRNSKVKRACASCRANKVQCDVDWPCRSCVMWEIRCVEWCRTCGGTDPGCMSCAESSGDTHHHYQESPAAASTSSSLQDRATPASPSSPPESPLSPSPYSRRRPHNHTAVCALDADSHNSSSQDHSPPTPTPSPSLLFQAQPNLSWLRSAFLHNSNTVGHMAAPTLDPRDMCLDSEGKMFHPNPPLDYERSPGSPASCYPSRRPYSGSYYPPTVSHESAPALSPLGIHLHPQDDATPASSFHPPQTNPTPSSSHAATSRVDHLARHPYHHRAPSLSSGACPSPAIRHDFVLSTSHQHPLHLIPPKPTLLPRLTQRPRVRTLSLTIPIIIGLPASPAELALHQPSDTTSCCPRATNILLISSPPNQPYRLIVSRNDLESGPSRSPSISSSGSQPLQRSLPFISHQTRPQAVYEPPKVTLPSFAEVFPEFVGSSLSNL
ncbi:hypothetical protein BU17DRAFT_70835 [Hysterangium stoloniferum]|nr:hypothetical protein BU17DRAFT_70835 [Hysterangium stoloniferum]